MTKYKVIVFDIDGTLLPFGVDELTPRTKEMFEKLKANLMFCKFLKIHF